MGREIRKVPPDWNHPKDERDQYQPIANTTFDEWRKECKEWDDELELWISGKHPLQLAPDSIGDEDFDPIPSKYAQFCGERPALGMVLPYARSECTWVQMYETVSEGTPVTPPFSTEKELIAHLCKHGTFWDKTPWTRNNAEHFVKSGWAPSLVVTPNGSYDARTIGDLDVKN